MKLPKNPILTVDGMKKIGFDHRKIINDLKKQIS